MGSSNDATTTTTTTTTTTSTTSTTSTASTASPTTTTTSTTAMDFLQKEMASSWQWRIDTDPELAASLGLLNSRRSTHALDPRSPESFQKRLKWVTKALERIKNSDCFDGIADSELPKDDLLSYKLYVAQLTDYVNYTTQHKSYVCCINRLEGPQTDLPLYARYLPVKTLKQREFYRDFLKAVPVQLTEVMQLLQIGLDEKRIPAKTSLEGVPPQIQKMIDGDLESFRKPIADCFSLPEEQHLMDECTSLIDTSKCTWQKLVSFLKNHYLPNLRDEISATHGYPDGEAFYKDCLEFHTTTTMTPQEIHQLGLDEVARIRQKMNDIATNAGFADNRLQDYMEHLRTGKEFEPKDAQSLLAHYRDITGRISPALLNLFHIQTLPRSPFEIKETPPAGASMAPAAYYLAGSPDPSQPRPGMFYVNTSELPTRRTYECEALSLHEAIPGHHTQASIQGENSNLPDFRRYCEDRRYFEAPCRFPFYTGYIEGWGLHCETLGEELNLYKNPSDRMGQLSMEALRSCRLVVDTGMHALGWSAEEALQYMLTNTAMGEHDAKTEVSRYITWPGQATAYKVGERFIRKLRTKAERAFGSTMDGAAAFDPRDFYHVVLTCGPVPLSTLETLVDEYIAAAAAGRPTSSGDAADGSKVSSTGGRPTQEPDNNILEAMTFANWCKCCVVPGTHDL